MYNGAEEIGIKSSLLRKQPLCLYTEAPPLKNPNYSPFIYCWYLEWRQCQQGLEVTLIKTDQGCKSICYSNGPESKCKQQIENILHTNMEFQNSFGQFPSEIKLRQV